MTWLSRSGATENATRDDGDIVLGWLARIVIGIAAIGILACDGLSIGIAHVSAVDDADDAALAASHAWVEQHSDDAALRAAQAAAAQHGETVLSSSLRIADDGTVRLSIEHDATTLVVRHIHALRSWTRIVEGGSGRYVSP